MSAIAGIWSKSGPQLLANPLRERLEVLRHRGGVHEKYLAVDTVTGTCSLKSYPAQDGEVSNLLLGHGSSSGPAQPVSDSSQTHWLVMDGYLANKEDLASRLGMQQADVHDSQVILQAWHTWGEACLHELNGEFAMALIDVKDANQPVVWLATDRLGVKPLFYAEAEGTFSFASEIKALVNHAVPFRPDHQAVFSFLALGNLPSPTESNTFFQNIHRLAPGHFLKLTTNGFHSEKWYDIHTACAPISSPAASEVIASTIDDLNLAVARRLQPAELMGWSLSGGVDSSSVVGLANRLFKEKGCQTPLRTVSAVYHSEGRFNELPWIKMVVDYNKLDPIFCYPDEYAIEAELDPLIWHQEEPFTTTSIFAQWCVMHTAQKSGLRFMMEGVGADGIFAGNAPAVYQEYNLELFQKRRWLKLAKELIFRSQGDNVSFSYSFREFLHCLVWGAYGSTSAPTTQGRRAAKEALCLNERWLNKFRQSHEHLVQLIEQETEKLRNIEKRNSQWRKERPLRRLLFLVRKDLREAAQKKRARIAELKNRIEQREISIHTKLKRALGRLRGTPKHDLRQRQLEQALRMANALRYLDRNSSAHGVETLLPFCDHRLFENGFRSANEYKIYRGWTKWVLRKALENYVPKEVLWKKDKVGFETPEREMVRQVLRQNQQRLFQCELLLEFLDPAQMEAACQQLLSSNQPDQVLERMVWRWLVIESWYRQFSAKEGKS